MLGQNILNWLLDLDANKKCRWKLKFIWDSRWRIWYTIKIYSETFGNIDQVQRTNCACLTILVPFNNFYSHLSAKNVWLNSKYNIFLQIRSVNNPSIDQARNLFFFALHQINQKRRRICKVLKTISINIKKRILKILKMRFQILKPNLW